MGWEVVAEFVDAGVSGAKGRGDRPQFDGLQNCVAKRQFDIVAARGRLGRSLIDLIGFLQELHSVGVDLYLHQQGVNTSTPAGKALFGMLGVFAEFGREMNRERVNAGLARARERGTRSGRPIRCPRVTAAVESAIRDLRGKGLGVVKIAKLAGCGVSTVQRVLVGDGRVESPFRPGV